MSHPSDGNVNDYTTYKWPPLKILKFPQFFIEKQIKHGDCHLNLIIPILTQLVTLSALSKSQTYSREALKIKILVAIKANSMCSDDLKLF